MFFLLGFALGMTGLALLIVGEFSWLGGKKIPARTGRQIGAVLVSFLPLAIAARFILHRLDPEETVEPAAVYGSVAGLVVLSALFLLFRAVRAMGRRPARAGSANRAANPFDAAVENADVAPLTNEAPPPPWSPPPVAGPKKKPGRGGAKKSPFDFG